jgi:hypothetical protein
MNQEPPLNLINWDFQSRINRAERQQELAFRRQLVQNELRAENRALAMMLVKAAALSALALALIVATLP